MAIHFSRTAVSNALAAFLVITCLQETLLLLIDHNRFAGSIICTDPVEQSNAGRFAALHCQHHRERGNYWSLRNVATLLVDSNIWFVVLWSLAISGATIVYDLSAGVNARHNRAVALKMLGMPKCSEKVYCK